MDQHRRGWKPRIIIGLVLYFGQKLLGWLPRESGWYHWARFITWNKTQTKL